MGNRIIERAPSIRLAQASLLAFIFSLIFMQPSLRVAGFQLVVADGLFLLTATLWLFAIARGTARLRWHPFFWLLVAYFAALFLSAAFSADRETSMVKLAGEAYLLSLPVLALSLWETERDIRNVISSWLGATLFLVLLAVVSLLLFHWRRDHPLLDYTLFGFGSLPEGPYPRLRLTFFNANMLCHYLSIAVMLALAGCHLGWFGSFAGKMLVAGILFTAIFTISPGLGSIALGLGLWTRLIWHARRPRLAKVGFAIGGAASIAFLGAAMIAPELHSTAPFLVEIPFFHVQAAPSGRVLTWAGSIATFLAHPVLGNGLGLGATSTSYLAPTGMQHLTDAHNMFLNIAAESGLPGLMAILSIAVWLIRSVLPLNAVAAPIEKLSAAVGIALLGAFLYQGLAGSFEDARHLWVLFGLFLAILRVRDGMGQGSKGGKGVLSFFRRASGAGAPQ